jgi:dTDP-4-dehydrorhamnose reductase
MEDFVRQERPDALFHLAIASRSTGIANESWLVNYEWTSELAWITRQLGVRFVFTSSVMVFSDSATGPFTPDSVPDAAESHGYARDVEQANALLHFSTAVCVLVKVGRVTEAGLS